jgi:hypothetical protein
MQTSSGQQPPLPAAVAAELARLEVDVRQAVDPLARAGLADLGEAAEIRVLQRRAGRSGTRYGPCPPTSPPRGSPSLAP